MIKNTSRIFTAVLIGMFSAIPAIVIWGASSLWFICAAVGIAVAILIFMDKKEKQKEEWENIIAQREKDRQRVVERRRAEEAEERRKEAAAKRETYIQNKQTEFEKLLDSLEEYTIQKSGNKTDRIPVSGMDEIQYTGITARSNASVIGNYVSVDLETTGLTVRSKIIEISAVRFENFVPTEKFTSLINPKCKIPEDITEINHITDDMVADAPEMWEVMPSFVEFVGKSAIIGHNLNFDMRFLYTYGFDTKNPKRRYQDTCDIARSVIPKDDIYNYKLGTVCEYYGIYPQEAHRSLADALAAGLVFKELARERIGL